MNPNAPMESTHRNRPLVIEQNNNLDKIFEKYLSSLNEHYTNKKETEYKRAEVYDIDALFINEEFDKMINALDKFTKKEEE